MGRAHVRAGRGRSGDIPWAVPVDGSASFKTYAASRARDRMTCCFLSRSCNAATAGGLFARTKTADATRPAPTDARFFGVQGVPNTMSPRMAVGTLVKDPTMEYVVAVVVDRNHSDAKEMPPAITADAPAAAMKAGFLRMTLLLRSDASSPLKQHKRSSVGTARTLLYRTMDISDRRCDHAQAAGFVIQRMALARCAELAHAIALFCTPTRTPLLSLYSPYCLAYA